MPPVTKMHHDCAKPAAFLVLKENMSDKKFYIILIFLIAAIILAAYFSFLAPPGCLKAKKISGMPAIKSSYIADKKIIISTAGNEKFEYTIKGICYAPDMNGATFYDNYEKDIALVKQCGAASVRTYRPLAAYDPDGDLDKERTKELLDMSFKEGITLAVGFSHYDMAEGGLMDIYLSAFGDHPAVLMIVLGNEYNYHYEEWFSKEEWLEMLTDAVKRAKKLAPNRIIATVHGEMPSKDEYNEYVKAGIDLIMMNMYRGANFGFAKQNWNSISDNMPWVISEFGRGSKDAGGKDTSNIQSSMLQTLIQSMEHGYLFMLTDDPQKGEEAIAPNIGSEDSLGIFDMHRNPKKAVSTVKTEYDKIESLKFL